MKIVERLQLGCLGVLIGSLAACGVERPDTVLSDAAMENVLYDYHIAKALGEQTERGENYKRVLYMDYVYKKHDITEAQFDSSMVWFSRHPDVLSEIYKKVTERLRTEEAYVERLVALRENKPLTSRAGDSIDVWAWQRIYQLSGMPMDNRIAFTLPSDSNFKARDTLRWSVHFTFSGETYDSLKAPVMALQMCFSNDSVISDFVQIHKGGTQMLTLTGDTLGDIKEVNGFIYYPCQDSVKPLMMNRISLMRYHARAIDSLTLIKDSLVASNVLQKDTTKMVEQSEEPVKAEIVEETKKDKVRRPSPTEMRRSQTPQEQTQRNEAAPRRNGVNSRQPVTRIKQNVKLRKVDE